MNNKQGLLKLTIEEYYEGEKRCFYVEDENGISQILLKCALTAKRLC